MQRFLALQQFVPDHSMADAALFKDRSGHCQRLFRVISGLANPPFISLAGIAGYHLSGPPMEPRYPFWVPAEDIGSRQRLSLLADCVSGCQCLKAADDAFLKLHCRSSMLLKLPR
jgi:hypothetical protein